MTQPHTPTAELLDDEAATLQELAHACAAPTDWVVEHVHIGVLQCSSTTESQTEWRFSASTLVRARRIAQLERMFEADPQLAAMTVDLIEEVQHLRQRVRHLGG